MGDRWSTLEAAAQAVMADTACDCGAGVRARIHAYDCRVGFVWEDFMDALGPTDVVELIRLARLADGVTV